MAAIRLQRIIAQAGLASRRQAEEWIREGLVTINGKVATLGQSADLESDAIKVNGKLLHRLEEKVYYAFYKPRGVVCTLADPQGRATLSEYLGTVKEKLFPVGRLDFTTEGLLLLTNDGEWAEKVQKHPEIVRVYQVKVKGAPGEIEIDRVRRGGQVEGRLVIPHSVKRVEDFSKKSRIELSFKGALSADLKSFLDHKGLLSERLVRTAIGQVSIRGMKAGELKKLRSTQAIALVEQPHLGLREPEKTRDLSTAVRPFEVEAVMEKKRVIMRDIYRSKRIGPKLLARRKMESADSPNTEVTKPIRPKKDSTAAAAIVSSRPKIIPRSELEKQYFVATYGDEKRPAGRGASRFGDREGSKPRFGRPKSFGERDGGGRIDSRGARPERGSRSDSTRGSRGDSWGPRGGRAERGGRSDRAPRFESRDRPFARKESGPRSSFGPKRPSRPPRPVGSGRSKIVIKPISRG